MKTGNSIAQFINLEIRYFRVKNYIQWELTPFGGFFAKIKLNLLLDFLP